MEYIDVYDENGNKTNCVRSKNLIYKTGSWHRSVHIWIMNSNGELLIQQRAFDKETFAGLWAISVAGHVRTEETALDAAKRELKEEIDVDVKDSDLTFLFSLKRNQESKFGTLHVHDDVFLLQYDLDLEHAKLQMEEVVDVAYINPFDFEKCLLNHDPRFVPYTEEHKKLFDYLRHKEMNAQIITNENIGGAYAKINTNKVWGTYN